MFTLIILISSFFIQDTTGNPVVYATISTGEDEEVIAFSDPRGMVYLQPDIVLDNISVTALGYESYYGKTPDEGELLVLKAAPLPSGVIIMVTAPRYRMKDLIPTTAVFGRNALDHLSTDGFRSLTGLTSGVSVREYGGSMPILSISVRGADPGQVSYLVEEHRIDSPLNGTPGGLIDPSVFGVLELSRGGTSGFRQGGMAGTLSFLPEAISQPASGLLKTGHRGNIRSVARFPLAGFRIGINLNRLKGENETEGWSTTSILTGRSESLRYGFLACIAEGETENPDWSVATDGERSQSSYDVWATWTPSLYWKITSGSHFGRLRYSSTTPSRIEDIHRDGTIDASVSRNFPLSTGRIEIGSGLRSEIVRSTTLGYKNRSTADISTFLSSEFIGIPFFCSSRWDCCDKGKLLWAVRSGVALSIDDSTAVLSLNGSKNYRRPCFNDLYWPEDEFAEGNENLDPENSIEAEISLSFSVSPGLRFFTTGFYAVTEDLIIWLPGEEGLWRPENIARAKRIGLESSGWMEWGNSSFSANLTLMRSTDETRDSINEGNLLPYRPEITWGCQADMDFSFLAVTLNLTGTGIRFINRSQTADLPAYSILGGSLDVPVSNSYTIGFYGTNILDENYEETNGFRGDSRELGLFIRWKGN